MARPIDEKIVALKMDDSDFKRKASQATGLFGKLSNALNKIPGVNLGKVTKDMGSIQKAANNTNLNGLSNSVDTIASRFSTLGVVATTALANISNRAVDTGIMMVKSLSTDQIMAGFQEYELKMGSIGTMLANTEWSGTTLKDVNKTIGELNDYADKTIYNFAEMTASIGRFTAAGVTLEDSTTAIKGLGNLAAISGSTSAQMDTAMYQMSQALAAGYLNLMDWNSMVNAGMGGKKTQDALLKTAEAMGVNVDMSEGFRNSISQGWLTSEIFLKTLKQFGEDESMTEAATKVRTFTQMMDTLKEGIGSGWAESFEIIFGDFEEATKLWTAVSETVGGFFQKQTDARNDMLRAIFDGGGLENVMSGLKNVVEPIGQIFSAVGKGFKNAFPPMSVDTIKNLVSSFKDFTDGLAFSEGTVKNLETIFTGFFSVLSVVWKFIKGTATAIFELIPSFDGVGAKLIELIANVAGIPIAFDEATSSGDVFESVLNGLKKAAGGVATGLEFVIGILVNLSGAISEVWSILTKGDFTGKGPWEEDSKIVEWLFKANDGFKTLGKTLSSINFSTDTITNFFDTLKEGYNWVKDKFSAIGEVIANAMPSGKQAFAGGVIAGLATIAGFAVKIAWDLKNMLMSWGEFGGIGEGISDTLESLSGALNSFAMSIKAQALLTIAIAVGILSASFLVLSLLDASQVASGLYAIMGGLGAIVAAMTVMSKFDITGTGMGMAAQIIALSIAFSILSGALKKISDMNWGEITKGIVGLAGVMGVFSGAIVLMSKFGGPKVGASALQMIAIAGAIHIVMSAVEKMADINTGTLTKGLTTIGIVLLELGLFLKLTSGTTFGVGSAIGILAIAGALRLMVGAIRKMGEMDVDVLKQGLITIGGVLAAISAFAAITGKTGLLSASVGLVLISGALTALIVPIKALGNMDMKVLAKGLGAIAIALLSIGAASKLMTGMIVTGAGLMLFATALHLLIVPIATLGNMDLKTLAIGIGAIVVSLAAIGGTALLLAPAAVPLLAFSGALALLGVAMLAAGAGMALFATGLVTLAGLTAGAITTIVATLTSLIVGLGSLIPIAVDFVVDVIVQMATAIAENAPTIAEQMWQTMLAIMEVISENAPLIYEEFLKLILGFVEVWGEYQPQIVGAVMEAITATLNAIAERVTDFIDSGVLIITNFLDGIADSIPRIQESATNVVFTFIESMTKSVRENGPKMTDAVLELMGEILLVVIDAGVKMVNALLGWIPGVKEATSEIGSTAEKYIRDNFGAKGLGDEKGKEFSSSLRSTRSSAKTAASNVADYAENGLDVNTSYLGRDFGSGFASGIDNRSNLSKVASAARTLASKAVNTVRGWLDMHSPSRVMIKDGGFFGEGFAMGIADKAKRVGNSAKDLAVTAKDSLNKFLNGFELPEDDNELHFKAVVDYDDLDVNKFGRLDPMTVRPDTSVTSGLADSSRSEFRQNDDNTPRNNDNSSSTEIHENYYITVEDKGYKSRGELRKLAEQVQTEIKNVNDRTRISKGEEVAF